MLINTGKNTPIIDSNGEKRINSQTKFDEIVLHPMHGDPETRYCVGQYLCTTAIFLDTFLTFPVVT